MSDDIAFKIQLGAILPKLKEKVKEGLTPIVQDHLNYLGEGTLDGEDRVSLQEVKAVIMQNLEVFLDTEVLPQIYEKFNPVVEKDEIGDPV